MTTGWTNGCFDILHPGHIQLLSFAKANCNRLIVGLNSDKSVAELKGDGRPVNPFEYRKIMLLATRYVDEVMVIEHEADLEAKIKLRTPDVIFKGADYLGKPVTGWRWASVRFVETLKGYSTTQEINKRALKIATTTYPQIGGGGSDGQARTTAPEGPAVSSVVEMSRLPKHSTTPTDKIDKPKW